MSAREGGGGGKQQQQQPLFSLGTELAASSPTGSTISARRRSPKGRQDNSPPGWAPKWNSTGFLNSQGDNPPSGKADAGPVPKKQDDRVPGVRPGALPLSGQQHQFVFAPPAASLLDPQGAYRFNKAESVTGASAVAGSGVKKSPGATEPTPSDSANAGSTGSSSDVSSMQRAFQGVEITSPSTKNSPALSAASDEFMSVDRDREGNLRGRCEHEPACDCAGFRSQNSQSELDQGVQCRCRTCKHDYADHLLLTDKVSDLGSRLGLCTACEAAHKTCAGYRRKAVVNMTVGSTDNNACINCGCPPRSHLDLQARLPDGSAVPFEVPAQFSMDRDVTAYACFSMKGDTAVLPPLSPMERKIVALLCAGKFDDAPFISSESVVMQVPASSSETAPHEFISFRCIDPVPNIFDVIERQRLSAGGQGVSARRPQPISRGGRQQRRHHRPLAGAQANKGSIEVKFSVRIYASDEPLQSHVPGPSNSQEVDAVLKVTNTTAQFEFRVENKIQGGRWVIMSHISSSNWREAIETAAAINPGKRVSLSDALPAAELGSLSQVAVRLVSTRLRAMVRFAESTSWCVSLPKCWSPDAHFLFPREFRDVVKVVLLCHGRQRSQIIGLGLLSPQSLMDVLISLSIVYRTQTPVGSLAPKILKLMAEAF